MRVKKNESKKFSYCNGLHVRKEGRFYTKEAEENNEPVDFTNSVILEEIKNVIDGIDLNDKESTKDTLIFKYNDKVGSIKRNGYMLCLKIDGLNVDGKDSISHPISNMNKNSITNFMSAVKDIFKKYNKLPQKNKEIKEHKLQKTLKNYCKNEDHCCGMGICDNCRGDIALSRVKEPLYYILVGEKQDPSSEIPVFWTEVVGDENGYPEKSEAILVARDLLRNDFNRERHAYGVAGKVDISHFIDNSFWDSLDNNEIPVVWNSLEDQDLQEELSKNMMDNPYDMVLMNTPDSMNDIDVSEDYKNPVFMDVAKTKLLEKLGDSLLLIPDSKKECIGDLCEDSNTVLICLSPSYAISPLSNIAVPVSFTDGMISLPMADIPDPEVVFDGSYTENAMKDYDSKVQSFILNDAPKSDLMELNLDNIDDVKARIVDVINSMAENYQNNKSKLESLLDLDEESVLKEARYYLVSKEEEPKTMDEVKKITPMGFTDLGIAKDSMKDFSDSGKYADGLAILDTHFSNNNEKWEIL